MARQSRQAGAEKCKTSPKAQERARREREELYEEIERRTKCRRSIHIPRYCSRRYLQECRHKFRHHAKQGRRMRRDDARASKCQIRPIEHRCSRIAAVGSCRPPAAWLVCARYRACTVPALCLAVGASGGFAIRQRSPCWAALAVRWSLLSLVSVSMSGRGHSNRCDEAWHGRSVLCRSPDARPRLTQSCRARPGRCPSCRSAPWHNGGGGDVCKGAGRRGSGLRLARLDASCAWGPERVPGGPASPERRPVSYRRRLALHDAVAGARGEHDRGRLVGPRSTRSQPPRISHPHRPSHSATRPSGMMLEGGCGEG